MNEHRVRHIEKVLHQTAMAGMRLQKAWVFAVWSVVLMLTVITTGQHVFTDMAYGAAIGVACGAATLIFKRYAVDLRTLSALLLEWLCILVTIRVALYLADWRFYLLAMLIVAARQHASTRCSCCTTTPPTTT